MGARRRGGSRTGTFLVLVGILGVLSATFVIGVWTGHNWPVLFGHANKIPATAEPAGGKRAVAERSKAAEALPALTFYDELKAPLTAPPPPPRSAKPPRRAPPPAAAAAGEGATTRLELTPPRAEGPAAHPEPAPPTTSPTEGVARFTVQVAAYNARPQADALRATLAAAGHDARVVEATTASGMKYRVQVGAFATRPAAQDAAARLSAERSLAGFVTTR